MNVRLLQLLFVLFPTLLFGQQQTGGIDIDQHPVCGFDLHNHLEDQANPANAVAWEKYIQYVLPYLSEQDANAEQILTIPIVFHIVHDNEPLGTGANISDAQILGQLEVMNEDFAALNALYQFSPDQWQPFIGNPNIQFCLATEDPQGNPTTGIQRHNFEVTGTDWQDNNINSEVKPMFNWDPDEYLNIYILGIPGTTAAGGVVGFSNRPFVNLVGSPTDGVVADFRWVGAPGFPVSGFRTITHEIGHYLGLPHPFDGNDCNSDDGIADTPNMEEATLSVANLSCIAGFPQGPATCGQEHMYINYMDYVNENCYTSFTNGQINVMRSVLQGIPVPGFTYGSREALLDNNDTYCSIPQNDGGVIDVLSPSFNECGSGMIEPVVAIRNFGEIDLNSIQISYSVNDGTPVDFTYNNTIASGDNDTISLPAFTAVNGSIDFSVYTSLPNGIADEQVLNDTFNTTRNIDIASVVPIVESVEGAMGYPTPEGFIQFNPDGDPFFWQIANGASAYGIGNTCFVYDNTNGVNNNNPFGTIDALITPSINVAVLNNKELTFDYAYIEYDANDPTFSDTLIILAAVDCSPNFDILLYQKGGADLATAPASNVPFVPTADQWLTDTIDLSAFGDVTNMSFAFINDSGWGQRIFLDNISLGGGCALTAQAMTTNASCNQICNGTALVEPNDPDGNYTYQWDTAAGGQTTSAVNGLCAGTYEVTITDDAGCATVNTIEITAPEELVVSVTTTDETGNNANDGTASADANGGTPGYSYTWSNGAVGQEIAGLSPGNYFVTIQDANNCETTESFQIGGFDCSDFEVSIASENITCNGDSDGVAEAFSTGGSDPVTYNWSNGVQAPNNPDLLAAFYTVTATDADGCTAVAQVEITEPDPLQANVSTTSETGNNANDGTATVNPQGGTPDYDIEWSNGETTATIEGLMPGTYSVTVEDTNGCVTENSITVNSFNCGSFSATVEIENISCFGANDGTATTLTMGGEMPFTYNWSNGGSDSTIENLSPGNYSVEIIDANDCPAFLEFTITEPAELTVSLNTTDETANDSNNGIIEANANGGIADYTYLWSNNATTSTITDLMPGTYTVTITDNNGCTVSETGTVQEFGCVISGEVVGTDASCPNTADGIASVLSLDGGTGPFTYNWSNGDTDADAENLLPGTYTVTVEDGNGCPFIASVTIEGNDVTPPVLVLENPTISLGGNGTVTVTIAEIDGGSGDNCSLVNLDFDPVTFDCGDIGENEFVIVGTDASGNVSEETIVITVVDNMQPEVAFCPEDISVIDCNAIIEYDEPMFEDNCVVEFELLEGFESGEAFPSGTTNVVFLATDQGGNTAECVFTVEVDYDLTVETEVTDPSCAGFSDGFASFTVAGGFAPFFVEFPGGDPVDLSAGTYAVTVTDAMGCTITDEFEVEDPPLLTAELTSTTPATNNNANGEATVAVNGGVQPYATQWLLDGDLISTAINPTDLLPGLYTVIISDANDCAIQIEEVLIDNIVSTSNLNTAINWKVYPNPASQVVFVEIENEEVNPFEIEIINANGQLIQVKRTQQIGVDNTLITIDLVDVPAGVYWIKWNSDKGTAVEKLVVF